VEVLVAYWLKLSDDRPGMEAHFVALPMSWLWVLPIVAWQLWRAWARNEEGLVKSRREHDEWLASREKSK
jgi:hypothetical protein